MARRAGRAAPEERRATILKAAEACFASAGYHKTTIDDIAEGAGLSKGAVYWHFDGKRQLFLALLESYFSAISQEMEPGARAGSAREALEQMSEAALQIAPVMTGLVELMLEYLAHAARDDTVRAFLARTGAEQLQMILVQIERGIASGEFRRVDAVAAATAFVAPLDGLMIHKVIRPEVDVAAAWREGVELMLRGLLAPQTEQEGTRG